MPIFTGPLGPYGNTPQGQGLRGDPLGAGGGVPVGHALAFVRSLSTTVRGQAPVTVRSA